MNASWDLAQSCAHRRILSAGTQSRRFLRTGGIAGGASCVLDGDGGADPPVLPSIWVLPSPPVALSVELVTSPDPADDPEPVTDGGSAATFGPLFSPSVAAVSEAVLTASARLRSQCSTTAGCNAVLSSVSMSRSKHSRSSECAAFCAECERSNSAWHRHM